MRLRPDWERYQYNDITTPVAIFDENGNKIMVPTARGYRRLATQPLPSATILDIRYPPGTQGSKF
jgi:hypothetical protein